LDAFHPTSAVEYIFVDEFVKITWENRRITQLKSEILAVNLPSRPEKDPFLEILAQWNDSPDDFDAPKKENKKIEKALPEPERPVETIPTWRDMAVELKNNIEMYERLERLQNSNEMRRDRLLSSLDYYRRQIAVHIYESVNDIIDGECVQAPLAPTEGSR
jgi:hypothetical protein